MDGLPVLTRLQKMTYHFDSLTPIHVPIKPSTKRGKTTVSERFNSFCSLHLSLGRLPSSFLPWTIQRQKNHCNASVRSQGVKGAWLKKHGLMVSARYNNTSEVLLISYQFSFLFGREKFNSQTFRKIPIFKTQHWKQGATGFRADVFVQHIKLPHPDMWSSLLALRPSDLVSSFQVDSPFVETIESHFGHVSASIETKMGTKIV